MKTSSSAPNVPSQEAIQSTGIILHGTAGILPSGEISRSRQAKVRFPSLDFLPECIFGIRTPTRLAPGGDRGLAPVGELVIVSRTRGFIRNSIVPLAVDASLGRPAARIQRCAACSGSFGPAANTSTGAEISMSLELCS